MVKCEMCGKVIIGTENKRFCANCFRERMRVWGRARQRAAAAGNPVRKCFYCGREFVGKNQQIVCPDCKSSHLRQASTAPQTLRHSSLCKVGKTKKNKKAVQRGKAWWDKRRRPRRRNDLWQICCAGLLNV